MTKSLFSVCNVDEAILALHGTPGILDLKNPDSGTLGALNTSLIRKIVSKVQKQATISATIGDLPPDPTLMANKIEEFVQCGVNYIKIGMFGAEYIETCPAILQQQAKKIPLVAVLFADRFEHFAGPCELLAHAGFAGVMLDTADKQSGGLRQLLNDNRLKKFIDKAHQLSLFCGLAGSLKKEDVAPLLELKPDYLGFRTALCQNQQRNAALSESALMELSEMFSLSEVSA